MAITELLTGKQDDCTVYGVSVSNTQGMLLTYPDISASRGETERLLRRLRDGDVSLLHYDDIVRDYILALAYERLQRNGLN